MWAICNQQANCHAQKCGVQWFTVLARLYGIEYSFDDNSTRWALRSSELLSLKIAYHKI